MEQPKQRRMGRGEFRRWVEQQDGRRYELVDGEPVAMSPERAVHVRVKANVHAELRAALRGHGGDCEAFADGMTVEIDETNDYEPDALVNCGPRIDSDSTVAPNPVIVVEVLSPGNKSTDTGVKLDGYLSVPSVVHYLIVQTARRGVIHHRRTPDGSINTRILRSGPLDLDPPGIVVDIDRFYDNV